MARPRAAQKASSLQPISNDASKVSEIGCVFISLGRGPVVDESALCKYIAPDGDETSPSLGGVALDVFEKEPLPETSPLWKLPKSKCLLSYHSADILESYFQDSFDVFYDRFAEWRGGQAFADVVDLESGY